SEYLTFDLLYQVSYMSAIATAGIPRNKIFEFACQLPCYTSRYFKEIQTLAEKMRYDYATACRKVGETAREEPVRGLLLRWSSAMTAGEAEADFLGQEAKISVQAFENAYIGSVDSLRQWTEAYAAIIISTALIVMVSAISMLIYPVATGITVMVIGLTIATGIAGAYVIWKIAPKEIRLHSPAPYCIPIRRARRLQRVLVPAAVVSFLTVLVAGAGIGWALIICSALLLPVGIAGIIVDRHVKRKDVDIATLLRTTGNVASAVGITTSQALDKLDLRSTTYLTEDIKHLRSRLLSRLNPNLCWERFSLETGSETVYRSVKMFNDATRLGGEPHEAGERSALLPMSINFLRAKRSQVSASFRMLALGLHITVVGLLTFVVQVIMAFSNIAGSMYVESIEGIESTAIEVFALNFETVKILDYLTKPTLILMAITIAFAAKTAEGGSNYTIFTYLAITLATAGIGMIIVPVIASGFFTPVTGF
ncbi:MAG: hypothetical protein V3S51_07510, partial [Dehalococcoidia bacterium]